MNTPLAPSAAPLRRYGLAGLLLLPAAAAGGLGLATLASSLRSAPPPPVDHVAPLASRAAPGARAEARPPALPWPALFGSPPLPEAEPAPEAVEIAQSPEPVPPLDARLRGLALDDSGGWAMVETDTGIAILRPGDQLDLHRRLTAILPEGAMIAGPEGASLLAFTAEGQADASVGRLRDRLADMDEAGGNTVAFHHPDPRDAEDMLMPQPQPGAHNGPGFMGPVDR